METDERLWPGRPAPGQSAPGANVDWLAALARRLPWDSGLPEGTRVSGATRMPSPAPRPAAGGVSGPGRRSTAPGRQCALAGALGKILAHWEAGCAKQRGFGVRYGRLSRMPRPAAGGRERL